MGKTGGGRGTNQHAIKGTSKQRPSKGQAKGVAAGSGAYPSVPLLPPPVGEQPRRDHYDGIESPAYDLDLIESLTARIEPTSVERVVARYEHMLSERVFSDAYLEGNTFTLPEVQTLLDGRHVVGHTEGEEQMVLDLQRANRVMLDRVEEGPVALTQALSDDLHLALAAHTDVPWLGFRGDYTDQLAGPRVRLGGGRIYQAVRRDVAITAMERGLAEIGSIGHPVARAATWAAFATYHQFYLDGNKRTGRYVMNAVLLSRGYDAIHVTEKDREAYTDVVVGAYETGDLTDHIAFLVGRYRH